MEVDLPPVQNLFLADPPSFPLRLMYIAIAAAWCVCGYLPKAAVARMRCCALLLYGTPGVSIEIVDLGSAPEARW